MNIKYSRKLGELSFALLAKNLILIFTFKNLISNLNDHEKKDFPLCLLCLFFSSAAEAQCTNCFNMEEALKDPSQVTYLNLRDKGLKTLPAEMALFTNLRVLDLSYNEIFLFPAELFTSSQLKEIKLNNNYGLSFVDLIYSCSRLENLESLELSNCGIHFIPENIADLSKLKSLDLSANQIKTIPGAVESLTILKTWILPTTKSRTLCTWVAHSGIWKKLDVSGNKKINLGALFLGLSFVENLEELIITDPSETLTLPKEAALLNVSKLVIKNSNIKKLNPSFGLNKSVKHLVFEDCSMSNPDQVSKQLEELTVAESFLLPIEELGKMKKLKKLDLRLQELTPEQQAQLKADLPQTTLLFTLNDFNTQMLAML